MKKFLLLIASVFVVAAADAQNAKDPSHWHIHAGPGREAYNILFSVTLDSGWHIWSLAPGGDGSLIAPEFAFDKGNYTLVGKASERGDVKEETMEGIDGKVRYFTKEAEFAQGVKAAPGTLIKGSYTYQLCNNMMCLPPKKVSFEFRTP